MPTTTEAPTTPLPDVKFMDLQKTVYRSVIGGKIQLHCGVQHAIALRLLNPGRGEVMASSSVVSGEFFNVSIELKRVEAHDAGVYVCQAIGERRTIELNMTLHVKPVFDIEAVPLAKPVPLGGVALLQCCIKDNRPTGDEGNPPMWEWTRSVDKMRILRDAMGKSHLLLIDVQKSDEGNYTCEASAAGYGKYHQTVHLQVDDQNAIDPFKAQPIQLDSCSSTTPAETIETSQQQSVTTRGIVNLNTNTSSQSEKEMDIVLLALIAVMIILIALLIPILVICFLQQRRKVRLTKKELLTQRELNASPPLKPNPNYTQTAARPDSHSVESGPDYQEIPSPDRPSQPSSFLCTPSPDNGAGFALGRLSGARSHSPNPQRTGAAVQENSSHGRHPIYAEVLYSAKSGISPAEDGDGGPYAESTIGRFPSVSSEQWPPTVPPRLLSSASNASLSERDERSDSPQLNLYDDPENVRSEARESEMATHDSATSKIYEEPSIRPEHMLTSKDVDDRIMPLSAIYEEPPPLAQENGPPEIDSLQLDVRRKIGEGQFGDVFMAMMYFRKVDGQPSRQAEPVALKYLKTSAGKELVEAFEKEVKFMSRLDHPNVVRLLGVRSRGEPCMVIELMANGDLQTYLNSCKLSLPDQASSPAADGAIHVTFTQLLHMAQQVASGMDYMSQHSYVHRDLAARNCLVDSEGRIKLGDFGLSRHLYDKAYYRIHGSAVLPIRWMAPESFYGRFSSQSDVFSFGITIWEIITLCREQPFSEYTDSELIQVTMRLMNSGDIIRPRPIPPFYCVPDVSNLLQRCWEQPEIRPTFHEISSELKAMVEK